MTLIMEQELMYCVRFDHAVGRKGAFVGGVGVDLT